MMDHTFVVLAYKESEHLEACLQSLMEQTEKSSVLISTSTPSPWLEKTAKEYGIPCVISPSATGIANDWNFAVSSVDTEYVTLAHQDDLFHKEYVQYIRKMAVKYPENTILFCNYAELFDGKMRKYNLNLIVKRILLLPMLLRPILKHKGSKKWILSLGNPICCPSVTYHKSCIPDFRFNSTYSINLDWDAWIRIAELQGSFVYLRKILFYHRIHSLSETSSGLHDNRRQNEDREIFHRLWPSSVARMLSALYAIGYKSNKG